MSSAIQMPGAIQGPSDLPAEAETLAARPAKNSVDPRVPWAFLAEDERSAAGHVVKVATIFLTNRECPFRCLMCDLWKNTTDETVPAGAIAEQIDHALARLPACQQVKLYNSGNFFDPLAIAREDYPDIAARVRAFKNVIVENHPRLCGDECLRFRDLLGASLEIALGLETIHPVLLPALNKRMSLGDFDRATDFLRKHGIAVRAFVLLGLPLVGEDEAVDWTLRSIEHALAAGVGCCSIIPTRAGNGVMDRLLAEGRFTPPRLSALEMALEAGIPLGKGRVFVDLWDAERLVSCPRCGPRRIERLRRMNLSQKVLPSVDCECDRAT
jgi:radical SAM enzyme (TIGR01210 family)